METLSAKQIGVLRTRIHKERARPDETPLRSILKTISWRVIGTLDTVLLSWFITGTLTLAFSIGLVELFSKLILYFFHERGWSTVQWGKKRNGRGDKAVRSLVKTVSWRIVGTLDTIVLSYLITGQVETALSIGGVELITKMVLYFIHERVWSSMNFGFR